MIIVLKIFCIIVTLVYSVFLILIFSNIIFKVEDCNILYDEKNQKKIKIKKIKASIDIYIFKKIKILNIKIHENYCEIFKIKINFNLLTALKDNKQSGTIFVIKNICELKPKIKKIYLNLNLGTESLMLTTFLVPIISTLVSIILRKYIENSETMNFNDNLKLKIAPMFINENIFELNTAMEISFDTIRTLIFIRKHKKIKA